MSQPTRRYHDEAQMLWWPYQQYVLKSRLSLQQIKKKLDHAVENGGVGYAVQYLEKLILIKEASEFKFGAHSRSFKPEITLVELSEQNTYRVSYKLNTIAILLLVLAVIIILAAIAFSKRNALAIGNYKDPIIAGVCVLLVGYFLPVISFNAELSKLKLFIDDLLEVDP